jgi:hypothetical protein
VDPVGEPGCLPRHLLEFPVHFPMGEQGGSVLTKHWPGMEALFSGSYLMSCRGDNYTKNFTNLSVCLQTPHHLE